MKYGNCLLGALILLWIERKNNPQFLLRVRPQTITPHFMVKTKDELIHYRVVKDILPWPLQYLVFEGEFQKLPHNQEYLFNKLKNN